jgi:nitrite reductase (NO-forming)
MKASFDRAEGTTRRTDRSLALTSAVVLSIAALVAGVSGMAAFIATDDGSNGAAVAAVDAPAPPEKADAKPVTIDEMSRHPSAMPDSADYATYRDGKYSDLRTREGPMTHEVHFTLKEGVAEIVPGTTIDVWTFDGAVPGPMVRARVGDAIDFFLTNPPDSSMPHNVDFHAVTGPGGGSARLDTAPGATSELRVKLLKPGVYLYHCAFPHVPTHMSHGMYGLVVVEPEGGLPPVDHEYYLMQSEFYTARGGREPTTQLDDAGHLEYSSEYGLLEQPTFVVFNGRPDAVNGDRALGVYEGDKINTGERVRLFVGNAGPNLASSFHNIGEIFDTVYVEGSFALVNRDVQTTLIPAGGAAAVEFLADVPGSYLLVDHAIFRTDKGAAGTIHVEGAPNPDVFEPRHWSSEIRGEDPGH